MDVNMILDELNHEAAQLLDNDRIHDEVILLKTVKGNLYHQMIRCTGMVRRPELAEEAVSVEAEVQEILSLLQDKEDTRVQYILAVVNSQVVDARSGAEIPPFCIRQGLLDLDPGNVDTVILTDGIHNRSIADSMPM